MHSLLNCSVIRERADDFLSLLPFLPGHEKSKGSLLTRSPTPACLSLSLSLFYFMACISSSSCCFNGQERREWRECCNTSKAAAAEGKGGKRKHFVVIPSSCRSCFLLAFIRFSVLFCLRVFTHTHSLFCFLYFLLSHSHSILCSLLNPSHEMGEEREERRRRRRKRYKSCFFPLSRSLVLSFM